MKVTREVTIKDLKDLEQIENRSFLNFENERVIYKNTTGVFVYADSGEILTKVQLKRIIKKESERGKRK